MSLGTVTIYGYEIKYVQTGDIIDYSNYNNFVSAIKTFIDNLFNLFKVTIDRCRLTEWLPVYNKHYSVASKWLADYARGKYMAQFLTPVYTHHYSDHAELFDQMLYAVNDFNSLIKSLNCSIPFYKEDAWYYAYEALNKYKNVQNSVKHGKPVMPDHHNFLVETLYYLSKSYMTFDEIGDCFVKKYLHLQSQYGDIPATAKNFKLFCYTYPETDLCRQFMTPEWYTIYWIDDILPYDRSDKDHEDCMVRIKFDSERFVIVFDVWEGEHHSTNTLYYADIPIVTMPPRSARKYDMRHVGTYEVDAYAWTKT